MNLTLKSILRIKLKLRIKINRNGFVAVEGANVSFSESSVGQKEMHMDKTNLILGESDFRIQHSEPWISRW